MKHCENNKRLLMKGATCFILALGLLGCLNAGTGIAYKFYDWQRIQRLRQQKQEIREKILKERSKRNLLELSEKEICLICLVKPREILLMSCGHVVVCMDCNETEIRGKCPICNKPIRSTHPAFIV